MRITLISIVLATVCVTSVADEYLRPRNLNNKNLYFDDEQELDVEVERAVEQKPAKRPAPKRQEVVNPAPMRKQRRLASVEPATRNDGTLSGDVRVPTGPKESWVRFNALGGISNISGDDSSGDQSLRNAAGVQRNTYVGANLDITVKRYFGLEVEGFYGLAANGTDSDGTNSAPASLQQMGGIGILKVQAPVRTGRFVITPKLGGGYGLMNIKHQGLYGPAAGNSDMSVRGLVGVAGLELDCFNTIILSVDYAKSFGAGGSYNASTLNAPEALTGAAFDRFRVSVHYRVTSNILLGAQWQQRRVGSEYVGVGFGAPTSQERLSQITGSLGLEF